MLTFLKYFKHVHLFLNFLKNNLNVSCHINILNILNMFFIFKKQFWTQLLFT